jgi:hypothetical protein
MIAPIISIVEQITCGFRTLDLQFSVIVLIGFLSARAKGISVQQRAYMFGPVGRLGMWWGWAAGALKMVADALNLGGPMGGPHHQSPRSQGPARYRIYSFTDKKKGPLRGPLVV